MQRAVLEVNFEKGTREGVIMYPGRRDLVKKVKTGVTYGINCSFYCHC